MAMVIPETQTERRERQLYRRDRANLATILPEYRAELSPAELSPAELSPAELSPAELSPAELSPAELSPAELSPAELSAAAYSSAQTQTLMAISAHAGLSPELIVRNTWEHTGNFYIRVLSHNGDTSLQPFTVSARVLPGTSCSLESGSRPAGPSISAWCIASCQANSLTAPPSRCSGT